MIKYIIQFEVNGTIWISKKLAQQTVKDLVKNIGISTVDTEKAFKYAWAGAKAEYVGAIKSLS